MTVLYDYDSDSKLHIPYKVISERLLNAVCDYLSCEYECEVSVSYVDNDIIKKLNKEYRGIDKPTDVLSFPLNEPGVFSEFNPETGELMLGDIVISVDKVKSQSKEYGHSLSRELAFLTCHSLLHLFGYDHMQESEREEMEDIQRTILDSLGYKR